MIFVTEQDGIFFQGIFAESIKLLEFLRVVIGGRDSPVEVVLKKDFLNLVVFDEGEFFCIERADVFGRQVFFKGPFFANRQNELHKTFVNIVIRSLLCFCPQEGFQTVIVDGFEKRAGAALGQVLGNDKVDVSQLGVFVIRKPVSIDGTFQRFFF